MILYLNLIANISLAVTLQRELDINFEHRNCSTYIATKKAPENLYEFDLNNLDEIEESQVEEESNESLSIVYKLQKLVVKIYVLPQ
ncbi:hypothetical protein RCL_jg25888.t1 [Rhizophagus clarus]|uniref:Uncharacterized protein n=1 Tax=Rhizophagus clarus TaxID=94130 RepID=A0A8H3LSQ8_9GLOM|nr:hypothetical protein RCL_jg25888.t1 [Rhizophagus clarus]